MSWKLTIRLIELGITATLIAALFFAWRAERTDRAKLAAELASAQQSLTQATDRQQSRDADLLHTIASLAAQKRDIQTPEQILKALSQQIPLPQPITAAPPAVSSAPTPTATTTTDAVPTVNDNAAVSPKADATKPNAPEPQAVIPAGDLKPLYDYALDCKACQAKLTAAQADLVDEKSKSATLTKERDDAVRLAKGGSALQRAARAAKWLLIGAAFGALAARK